LLFHPRPEDFFTAFDDEAAEIGTDNGDGIGHKASGGRSAWRERGDVSLSLGGRRREAAASML
jgi:hypothetical protein